MNDEVFEEENFSVCCNFQRLYMDYRTADVYFIFSNDNDRIPAHKNILSVGSMVFDAMFYGSLIEKDDILIVDASADAFKEFLQFFYLNKVRLSSENIGEVVNLCNKYELLDGLKICEIPLQNSLTINDMCWGYELSIFLGLDNLRQFCELKILENSIEILKSETFLESSRKSVESIMELIKCKCCPMVIIEACMEWAKAECERNDVEINPENLRFHLGDLFEKAPFEIVTAEQFFEYLLKFRDIMTNDEIKTITQTIISKKFQSTKYGNIPLSILPRLECDRRSEPGENDFVDTPYNCLAFSINRDVLLTEFHLPEIPSKFLSTDTHTFDVNYIINGPYNTLRGEFVGFSKVSLNSIGETKIILNTPVIIEKDKAYSISVLGDKFDFINDFTFRQRANLRKNVDLGDGIEIKFFPGSELISRITFLKLNT